MPYYTTCEVHADFPIQEPTCTALSNVIPTAAEAAAFLEGAELVLLTMRESGIIQGFELELHYQDEWRNPRV